MIFRTFYQAWSHFLQNLRTVFICFRCFNSSSGLLLCLEECFEQLRNLEKEEKEVWPDVSCMCTYLDLNYVAPLRAHKVISYCYCNSILWWLQTCQKILEILDPNIKVVAYCMTSMEFHLVFDIGQHVMSVQCKILVSISVPRIIL